MLKYLVAIFLILNLLLFGWMQGWIINSPKHEGRSSERIQDQIYPEVIQVDTAINLAEINSVSNTATQGTNDPEPAVMTEIPQFFCLESGPLNGVQSSELQKIIAHILPSQAWEMDAYTEPNSWAVYLGPFNSEDDAISRQHELQRQGISSNVVRGKPEFQPGITLGLYREQANAEKHLSQVLARGITDAKIAIWSRPPKGQLLRINELSEKQWDELYELIRSSSSDIPNFILCEDSRQRDLFVRRE